MRRLIRIAAILFALHAAVPQAVMARQSPVGESSAPIFRNVMDSASVTGWAGLPFNALMQTVGEQFIGATYEAGMLDAGDQETLMAPLDRFDCVLFVEAVLGMARGIALSDTTWSGFMGRIEEQRYRDGEMDGYCSRLHYFSEWIRDNERRGTVRNITADLGGEALQKKLTFMGTHRSAYPRLAASDSLFAGILAMEQGLDDLEFVHIPQERIAEAYPMLQAGDIVAISTGVEGLDVVHTGLVYVTDDGGRGLLHASSAGSVMRSPDLQSYVQNNRAQIGIVVARPVPPSSGLRR